jgi:branched-chain amino acid transport system ATP-binding protein
VQLGFPRRHGLGVVSVLTRGGAIRHESAEIEAMADELLDWVSLRHLGGREARQLSGGQRMLTALLRTIATSSSVILLDEPTAGVAPNVIPKITELIRTLSALGHTVCLIEHRMELVEGLSDWVVVMNEGKVALEGSAAEAMASEELQRIYFGEDAAATVGVT